MSSEKYEKTLPNLSSSSEVEISDASPSSSANVSRASHANSSHIQTLNIQHITPPKKHLTNCVSVPQGLKALSPDSIDVRVGNITLRILDFGQNELQLLRNSPKDFVDALDFILCVRQSKIKLET